MEVIIIDTETTGLKEPVACEIAYIELESNLTSLDAVDLAHLKSWEQRFRPTKAIEAGASKVHGIYMKDLIDCPSITTFKFPEETKYIVGHNVAFDHRVLGKPNVKLICTKELAQLAITDPKLKNHKLTTLVEYFYPEEAADLVENAHGALQDCKLVYLILVKILKLLPKVESWEQLSTLCSQGKKSYDDSNKVLKEVTTMPFGKHKGESFANIPTDYLQWLLKQDINENIKRAVTLAIADR